MEQRSFPSSREIIQGNAFWLEEFWKWERSVEFMVAFVDSAFERVLHEIQFHDDRIHLSLKRKTWRKCTIVRPSLYTVSHPQTPWSQVSTCWVSISPMTWWAGQVLAGLVLREVTHRHPQAGNLLAHLESHTFLNILKVLWGPSPLNLGYLFYLFFWSFYFI